MSDEKPLVVVIDTETTGIVEPIGICQIAMALFDPMGKTIEPLFQTYCKPSCPMTAKALETHGITPEMYANMPSDTMAVWAVAALLREIDYPVVLSGYNSDKYDYPVIQALGTYSIIVGTPKLDVMRLALRLDTGQGYKLIDVFTQLGLAETPEGQTLLGGAHDAMMDSLMTAMILQQFMQQRETDDVRVLLEELATPCVLNVLPHGKYRGVPFKEVRSDYLTWAASTWTDMVPELRWTFEHYGLL
jgi:DNA polymerase III epsilon subunit-like protein